MAWLRIEAPHFVAGAIKGGLWAPIIGYMRGWTLGRIKAYCLAKGWAITVYED